MSKSEKRQMVNDILDLAQKLRELGYEPNTINRMTSDMLDLPVLK